jgi:hypothetical protein
MDGEPELREFLLPRRYDITLGNLRQALDAETGLHDVLRR